MPGSSGDNRTLDQAETFGDIVSIFVTLINSTIPLIIGLILVFVIWKMIDTWILNAGDEKKIADGKQVIANSVLVMVVIASVWGIVSLLRNSLFM